MARELRKAKTSLTAEAIIADYRLAYSSRRASIIGRAEVLRGNATFGIFGDGKEGAQLAMAKLYRSNPQLKETQDGFSVNGNEVAFGTIGDAATSEGLFWESINAAGVLQVPLAMSVWDDGYGISVPISQETTKSSISDVLRGFMPGDRPGIDIYVARG